MERKDRPEFGRPARVLYSSPAHKADLEAENSLYQFDRALEIADEWGATLHLSNQTIKEFHRLAINRIYGCAGEYRNVFVSITNSTHVPPDWRKIRGLVDEMCAYANAQCSHANATHVAAFLLWRIGWIHPFFGGNGRVARAVSYLALCVGFGMMLPGENIVPQLLDRNAEQYFSALEAADRAWAESDQVVDPSDAAAMQRITAKLQSLINELLIEQIAGAV
jgi:Fic family protein